MHDKTVDRNISMVIFLTAVILAGLVTAGRDPGAAEQVQSFLDSHVSVFTSNLK